MADAEQLGLRKYHMRLCQLASFLHESEAICEETEGPQYLSHHKVVPSLELGLRLIQMHHPEDMHLVGLPMALSMGTLPMVDMLAIVSTVLSNNTRSNLAADRWCPREGAPFHMPLPVYIRDRVRVAILRSKCPSRRRIVVVKRVTQCSRRHGIPHQPSSRTILSNNYPELDMQEAILRREILTETHTERGVTVMPILKCNRLMEVTDNNNNNLMADQDMITRTHRERLDHPIAIRRRYLLHTSTLKQTMGIV